MAAFWKDKKRKKTDFFGDEDDLFSGFDDISQMMNEMMKRAFESPFSGGQFETGKPIVYGYSVKMGPEGKPQIEEFGNVQPKQRKIKTEREPLVDVIDKEKEVSVIAEMPGVEKKDIDLDVTEKGAKLIINVPKKFYKEVELPAKVKDNADASYKNGVLEVNLTKIKPSEPKKHKIKVE